MFKKLRKALGFKRCNHGSYNAVGQNMSVAVRCTKCDKEAYVWGWVYNMALQQNGLKNLIDSCGYDKEVA